MNLLDILLFRKKREVPRDVEIGLGIQMWFALVLYIMTFFCSK